MNPAQKGFDEAIRIANDPNYGSDDDYLAGYHSDAAFAILTAWIGVFILIAVALVASLP